MQRIYKSILFSHILYNKSNLGRVKISVEKSALPIVGRKGWMARGELFAFGGRVGDISHGVVAL